ncbi:MAG: hypothetical protein HUJ25_17740 [Crocinitomicaceae bacterium]|nr:hypothetical protein [Crocinitomicaceae bacterium]
MSLFIFLLLAVASMILSILSWRLKSNPLFIAGAICTGLMFLIVIANFDVVKEIILYRDIIPMIFFLVLLGFPIFFLIKAKTDKPPSSFDGSTAGGKVTEDYLDEIINAPDEDIDFEDGIDLK